jgi:hypothetical protein
MVDQYAKIWTTAELSHATDTWSECPYPRRVRTIARSSMPQLNIGHSAQWGFHPGGWGKPPLDEYNRPLYGDVFGVLPKANDADVSDLDTAYAGLD